MAEPPASLSDIISLSGKRALITGSAAGIGKAIAWRYGEAGAALELVDIDKERLEATGEELAGQGWSVKVHALDISDREQRSSLWGKLGDTVPDILVNNAAIYPFKEFLEVDEEFYEKVMAVNLDAVYWMCQEMIRRRRKQGGVIVNIGSIEALVPFNDDLTHYSTSKAGVIALTRALAKEYGKAGFRINALIPGGIATEGTKGVAKSVLRGRFKLIGSGIKFSQRLPIGRIGQPDEIARMALVLASDVSSYVLGAAIPVDGGFLTT
jgi:NAD(P)-dependent dehydrogenase (short-subunit alcohol dehydrogenase family)